MKRLFFIFVFCSYFVSSTAQNAYNIVPQPVIVKSQADKFVFNKGTRVIIPEGDPAMHNASFALIERFMTASDIALKEETLSEENKDMTNAVFFKTDPKMTNKEGYRLKITKERIEVEAAEAVGFFYAMQTIRQLLPPEIEKSTTSGVEWAVPCVEIEDAPRYAYRGLMVDVSRHFSSVKDVKRYIDLLAFHKINTFHWHLTDDQGWRIEIKKYPKLSEISAWRYRTLIGHGNAAAKDRKYKQERYGGFYTQEEIKDVVAYAGKKFVTIIPEIEMPGHALAALTAYPELSCTGGPFEVEGNWGIFNDIYCTRDETFRFLEDVLSEVMELFPGTYVHIGGDEAKKTRWERCHHCQSKINELGLKNEEELQSWFITRIEKFVRSKGRRIIGWEEVTEGGISPEVTVMAWRGIQKGITAARQGHDVIMAPQTFCYLDYYQSKDRETEPLANGGYLPLDKVYSFDPTPQELSAQEAKHILGGQANLWREYIPAETHLEYMLFPRLAALAEAVWSSRDGKDYEDFKKRLVSGVLKHYAALGINYANHP
ncbi:MAG: beta-N-acetylhexosaminidase [Bacteroidales bacterium]|jgi:hexosaminidase|nr:beta-N-acetylhexosaminidase [Bacteroidales bacterium]